LEQAARQGRFNQALIYGINMVPISFPPLRKRPEDIAILIDYFLKQACLLTKCSRRLLPDTREILMQYNWPGNVRELSHVIQRLVALSPDHEVGPDQLPAHLLPGKGSVPWKLLMKRLTTVPGMEEDRKRRLAELLLTVKNGHITNKDVRGTLNCSDSTAKNILRRLCQAGILEAIGRRGGRRYQIFPSEEN
jgi:DNA-binding NtrC family response regulator